MKAFCRINLFLILFFPALLSKAQYQDSVQQNKKAIDSLLANEHLDSLPGYPKTFYTVKYKTRAIALQQLVRECTLFYEKGFPGEKFDVPLYVLDSAGWNPGLFGAPYALPNYLPGNNIILMGAEKNALARLTGQPPGTVSDSIVSGYDYIALHELGHYFFITLHHLRTSQKWFDEFLANYFLVNFMKEQKKKVAAGWEQAVRGNDLFSPAHKTINDFELLYDGVGPANYDWYQKKFMKLAFQAYPQYKTKLVAQVLSNYAPGGMGLDAMSLMKKLAPQHMDSWLAEMK